MVSRLSGYFSARTAWPRATSRIAAATASRKAAGGTLLDLTETNPTRVGLTAPEWVISALADPGGRFHDPVPAGAPEARAAAAADHARRGIAIDPAHVVLTASTSEAYAYVFKLLCDPGDEVLVPRPSYPLFSFLADLESVVLRPYDLGYDGEWHVTRSALEAAASPRMRAVVVVSPNNPTGSFVKTGEAREVHAFAEARGIAVVSDEVFADFALEEDARRAPTLLGGEALTFALGGLSKSCGLPQLKLGWIAVGGPGEARAEALARLEVVADTYLSVGTPVQRAAPRILAGLHELQAPILARIRANHAHLARTLSGSAGNLLRVEGGWSAVVRVPAILPEEDWVLALLDRDHVLVHPGFFFDFPAEACLVLSLLPREEVFAEAISRVRRRIDALAETGAGVR